MPDLQRWSYELVFSTSVKMNEKVNAAIFRKQGAYGYTDRMCFAGITICISKWKHKHGVPGYLRRDGFSICVMFFLF